MMRAFMASNMRTDPARPIEDRLNVYTKLFDDFGPLSVQSVDDTQPMQIQVGMKSKKGDVLVTFKVSDAPPMQLLSVSFAQILGGLPR